MNLDQFCNLVGKAVNSRGDILGYFDYEILVDIGCGGLAYSQPMIAEVIDVDVHHDKKQIVLHTTQS